MSTIAPDQLFVIACPACHGHVAVTGGMCGCDACCPLCAALFHVPALTLAGPVVPPAPPPPLPAEDWGNVIETLAPPAPKVAPHAELDQPSDFEIPHESPATPVVAAPAEMAGEGTDGTPPTPSADWIDEVLATQASDETADVPSPPEGVPYLGPPLLVPADQELEFREPVRTVRHGDTVIEIRRLTPEERRARRFRRNLMMIVIGVSILLAIVVIFGVPTKPAR